MDNERPNEHTMWSSRLEEPGALPGTGLTDKEAAWDKLYDRLREQESPRRRRIIWLWAAAACFLLIIIPAALLLKGGHKIIRTDLTKVPVAGNSESKPAQSSPSDKPVPPAPTEKSSPDTRSMAATPQSGRREGPDPGKSTTYPRPASSENPALTRQAPHRPTRPTPRPSDRPVPTRPDLDKLLAPNTDTLTLVFAPRPDLSKPMIAAIATPKKEQRVVHINELEPSQPTPAMAKGPRQKAGGLRFGLVPENSFRPSTTYAGPEAHQILSLDEPKVRWPKARN
ncbi:MAG TPA: hypothetical protein VHD83_08680 [Puia sp.]|nr:hypothetical protein [Puia sp.]